MVLIYALLTFWQGCETHKLAGIAQNTFNAANRPYIGVEVGSVFIGKDATIQARRTDDTIGMDFSANIKNFGPVPGTSTKGDWKVFFGGIERHGLPKIADRPFTLFPTQYVTLVGTVGGQDYRDLMSGNKMLVVEVRVEYDGPADHYKECDKRPFNPTIGAFMNLGVCAF